ncbi:hypothetical protein IHE45_01G024500, partial [Dioscorea alata]
LRITTDDRFSPIHDGMLPESLFSPMSRVTNLLVIFKDKGRSPVRLLFLKCKDPRLVSDIRPLGILPVKLLSDKSINSNADSEFQHLGS